MQIVYDSVIYRLYMVTAHWSACTSVDNVSSPPCTVCHWLINQLIATALLWLIVDLFLTKRQTEIIVGRGTMLFSLHRKFFNLLSYLHCVISLKSGNTLELEGFCFANWVTGNLFCSWTWPLTLGWINLLRGPLAKNDTWAPSNPLFLPLCKYCVILMIDESFVHGH